MLKQVDKINGILVQKITAMDGTIVRYQTVPENKIGDSQYVKEFPTLTSARQYAKEKKHE